MIAGGHDHNGDARFPLDVESLRREAEQLKDQVSAFAVASAFAVRNPEHEKTAADIITRVTGKPVSLSSELTSSLDAPRRALTAVLNARLISRISLLIVTFGPSRVGHILILLARSPPALRMAAGDLPVRRLPVLLLFARLLLVVAL